ncbi:caffeic acid 3-O-methyltransferase-like isoform X2 [Asparagus officinalis]|uniref:caffeic acid 3-O-methyltransferase-like isoform X2 n=1 Tax=Asparagus officinalis TaxID=4686 RepID=UPI00098E1101|nr:caffeic acid 3-O-methyltransferase-like isoform X2 [Asparagus officinalis]
MASTYQDDQQYDASADEEMAAFLSAVYIAGAYAVPMTLKAVIELGVLDIIANAGPGRQLSVAEIVSNICTNNAQAATVLDRMLRYLASSSILTCSGTEGAGRVERRYGLSPVGKLFVGVKDGGASLAPLIIMDQHKARQDSWQELKHAVLDGVVPFEKVHGMKYFECMRSDPELSRIFNNGMSCTSTLILKIAVGGYPGFKGIQKLVDVGGGTGAALQMIVSKFPQMNGINFDLPHVISHAPPIKGVEHVAGDMFDSIPSGEAVFMKWILHDWSDEDCIKILKNCFEALPDSGKVIIAEFIIPEVPDEDTMTQTMHYADLCMLNFCEGKERTKEEFESLATEAGFSELKLVPSALGIPLIELYK